jgi:hypothetical protein
MKATLEFQLPEDQEELDSALNANKYYSILFEIRNQIFRPSRKHGYSDPEIQALVESLGDKGHDLIQMLEQKFNELLDGVDV